MPAIHSEYYKTLGERCVIISSSQRSEPLLTKCKVQDARLALRDYWSSIWWHDSRAHEEFASQYVPPLDPQPKYFFGTRRVDTDWHSPRKLLEVSNEACWHSTLYTEAVSKKGSLERSYGDERYIVQVDPKSEDHTSRQLS